MKGARVAQSKDRKKAKSEKLVQSVQTSNQEYSQFVCESKETTEEIKEKSVKYSEDMYARLRKLKPYFWVSKNSIGSYIAVSFFTFSEM